MSIFTPKASNPQLDNPDARWGNWSGVETSAPQRICRPASEEELAEILLQASRDGLRVKAIGAGHSFTPVAATDGVLISLDNLSGLVEFSREKMTVRLRAGTRLRDLPGLLRPHGVAVPNQGDVDPQSLAGAISTGTHGTGIGFTGFPGILRSFRMITADGAVHECFPGAPGVAGELFDLARISLGAYGIFTEVELDVVDSFVLSSEEKALPVDQVIDGFEELVRGNDHFEYFWFQGTDVAHTKQIQRLPGDAPTRPVPKLKATVEDEILNNVLFQSMNELAHRFPALTRPFAQLSAKTLSQREYADHSHDVFVSARRVRFNEMEYAVPLDGASRVLRQIHDTLNASQQRVLFPIEVRGTSGDEVPLSTAKGRESCYIAIHRYYKDDHRALFRELEPILKAAGGRPHWGKIHTLTHADLLERHEDLPRAVELRQRVDPDGVFRNAMVDRIFGLA